MKRLLPRWIKSRTHMKEVEWRSVNNNIVDTGILESTKSEYIMGPPDDIVAAKRDGTKKHN
jgi:hypothetical protein